MIKTKISLTICYAAASTITNSDMDDDFKQYRLPDDDNGSWILSTISRIGLDEFTEQENKVASALDKLKPGKFYDEFPFVSCSVVRYSFDDCPYVQGYYGVFMVPFFLFL